MMRFRSRWLRLVRRRCSEYGQRPWIPLSQSPSRCLGTLPKRVVCQDFPWTPWRDWRFWAWFVGMAWFCCTSRSWGLQHCLYSSTLYAQLIWLLLRRHSDFPLRLFSLRCWVPAFTASGTCSSPTLQEIAILLDLPMAIFGRSNQHHLRTKCWSASENVCLHQSVRSTEQLQGQAYFPLVHTFSRSLHCQLHFFSWNIFRVSSLFHSCQSSLKFWSAISTQFSCFTCIWTFLAGTDQGIPNQSLLL